MTKSTYSCQSWPVTNFLPTHSNSFSHLSSFCQMLQMWIRGEERWAMKVIQRNLFPDKVLGSIPIKPEHQNDTGSDFQCLAPKTVARCNMLSTPWLPAATFMAAFLKRFFIDSFLSFLKRIAKSLKPRVFFTKRSKNVFASQMIWKWPSRQILVL